EAGTGEINRFRGFRIRKDRFNGKPRIAHAHAFCEMCLCPFRTVAEDGAAVIHAVAVLAIFKKGRPPEMGQSEISIPLDGKSSKEPMLPEICLLGGKLSEYVSLLSPAGSSDDGFLEQQFATEYRLLEAEVA